MVLGERSFTNSKIEEYLTENAILSDPQIYMGYAAIEIVLEALGSTTEATAQNLAQKSFNTVIGPVHFDENGSNIHNAYEVRRWNGENLVPLDRDALTQ